MGEKIYHFVYLSNTESATKQLWVTSSDNDEIVNFVDGDGTPRVVNSLTIYSKDSDLYVALPANGDFCTFIPSGTSKSFDFLRLESFQILGNAPISYRWEALSY